MVPPPHNSSMLITIPLLNTQAFERHEQYAWQIKLGKTAYVDIRIKRNDELELYNHFSGKMLGASMSIIIEKIKYDRECVALRI